MAVSATSQAKGTVFGKYNPTNYQIDLDAWPRIVSPSLPGPKSNALHARATKIIRGLSGQVRLFPVAFASGDGCTMTDVDGNRYIDFSSGIYVTNLGHCHPKVSEAIAKAAGQLMNAHDFTTEVKVRLLEKTVEVMPGDLRGVQLYDSGTTAVEAALRTCRAATGKHEFLSCFGDFHGKSGHAVSLARMNRFNGPARSPGFYMVPRPDPYRPWWTRSDGSVDTEKYLEFYDAFIKESTTGRIAAFVLEPIQGWAGSIMPPDDFFPKLRTFCDERKILLVADEVLTGMGRTGRWLAMEHWDTLPDVATIGKGFGNGFPVTAMIVREPYAEAVDQISASTSYGGNPMACAAALASIEVIEEEGLLEHAQELEVLFLRRMADWTEKFNIVGDTRAKGCLMGVELVKDKATKEPLDEAGKLIYRRAFSKGLAWIPAGHILRMSPPIIMPDEVAHKAMDIIEESIGEVERELGYAG
ncbi:MAG: aspartate aminotransferase family protein [Planctomycetia bacterium]|nr:aspartate aminotransferase family protein [Planctomycetia bacterium]